MRHSDGSVRYSPAFQRNSTLSCKYGGYLRPGGIGAVSFYWIAVVSAYLEEGGRDLLLTANCYLLGKLVSRL